jgi:uncharacterized protein YndB with AHSA1/START domain
MSDYRKSVVVDANASAVYAALTTSDGLRGWWTHDCDVATRVGETIRFRFGRTWKDMRIERLEPEREVRWRCTRAHIAAQQLGTRDEWVGTEIVFRLAAEGPTRTRLDFEHVGLVPALECHTLCSDGWRYFLTSLQQLAETGRGTPHQATDPHVPCVAAREAQTV